VWPLLVSCWAAPLFLPTKRRPPMPLVGGMLLRYQVVDFSDLPNRHPDLFSATMIGRDELPFLDQLSTRIASRLAGVSVFRKQSSNKKNFSSWVDEEGSTMKQHLATEKATTRRRATGYSDPPFVTASSSLSAYATTDLGRDGCFGDGFLV
jgi:hypothetical protein